MRYSNSLSNSVSQLLWNRTDQNSLKVHQSRYTSVFGSLADSVLYVAHPNVLVLFGGSVELVHLRRTGVSDEEHTSFVIGYVPHDEVLQGEDWRFVLKQQHRRVGGKRKSVSQQCLLIFENKKHNHWWIQFVCISSYVHLCDHVGEHIYDVFSYQTWKDVLLVFLLKTHQDVSHQ